nr:uncharacterized protein Os08g0359500 isoform X2 [Ipomoea batatas]
MLPDAKTPKVSIEPDGVFTFSASAGAENHLYELKLELNDKVNVEESKINIGLRNIFCVLEKAEKQWWNRLLRAEGKPPHYVKVDWDKWADEDEDNGPADFDMGGMDFSKFGNMGGLGGMDFGNGAVGDDFDDSDDEEAALVLGAETSIFLICYVFQIIYNSSPHFNCHSFLQSKKALIQPQKKLLRMASLQKVKWKHQQIRETVKMTAIK